MWTLLADIFGAVLEALFGRWIKRRDAGASVRAENHQAAAEAASGEIRDHADAAVQKARIQNDETLAAAADAAGAGRLREQSADVAAAVAQANRELR